MRFRRKTIILALLSIVLLINVLYKVFMDPSIFYNNEAEFINSIDSMFSYYEYQFYTLILLPMYLVYFISTHTFVIQFIIREKNKKKLAFKAVQNNLMFSFLFVLIIYLVGVINPIIYGVMNYDFLWTYTLQCLFMWIAFASMGNIVLVIQTYTKNLFFQICVPMMLIMIYHSFRKILFNILSEINISVLCYANDAHVNFVLIITFLLLLLFISAGINIFVSSEEEYWDAK